MTKTKQVSDIPEPSVSEAAIDRAEDCLAINHAIYLSRKSVRELLSCAIVADRARHDVAIGQIIEKECLRAWDRSQFTSGPHDAVHPMYLEAFKAGARAADKPGEDTKMLNWLEDYGVIVRANWIVPYDIQSMQWVGQQGKSLREAIRFSMKQQEE